jgi:hypothetical protein
VLGLAVFVGALLEGASMAYNGLPFVVVQHATPPSPAAVHGTPAAPTRLIERWEADGALRTG